MSDLEYEQNLWPRIKSAFRVLVAFTFSHVGVCGLVVGYIICGAFLFQMMESHEVEPMLKEVRQLREETAEKLLSIVLKSNTLEEEEFFRLANVAIQNYTYEIVNAISDGYDGEPKPKPLNWTKKADSIDRKEMPWSFTGGFLYSLTVITTIGYGNYAPKTAQGKAMTILYGIIGMPLFLLYLSNIGDILARGFKWTFSRCCQCNWTFIKRRRIDENGEVIEEPAQEEEEQITVPISLCLTLMVGYIWGGGLLFAEWEKWSVLDASYFCFISLSTIGFGDLVPGEAVAAESLEDAIQYSFVFCSLYLLLGMALIAMCFNLMQEEVIAKVRVCGRRLGCAR
ncbi:unnamed protein product [Orchesella dallaii]|uniref:Potassium channel domain-containing protein n=1 Tax=Orchesella dallaii TaxID=48710 RepID=A0ABP1RL41_9HEXA